jgi:MFS family permease
VAAVRIASAALWGRAVDTIGARPVLVLCSFGISIVPSFWLFTTPERILPIAIEATTAGFLWAGHGIAMTSLSIAISPRLTRPLYMAALASAGGIGFSTASLLAGQLAAALPQHFVVAGQGWTAIHVLFVLSAIGRFAAAVLSLRLQDPRARGGVPELVRMLRHRARALVPLGSSLRQAPECRGRLV